MVKSKTKKAGPMEIFVLFSVAALLCIMWLTGMLSVAAVEGDNWITWLILILMGITMVVLLAARKKRRA